MAVESCDQRGSRCGPGPLVIWSGGPPASSRIHICREPVESLTKATDFPSGENAGLSSMPAKSVSRKNFTDLGPGSARPRNHHAPPATRARARHAIIQPIGSADFFSEGAAKIAPDPEAGDDVDSRLKARSRAD